jgi:ADP-dependent NAD(P)H-hydrate dehydratase / NAD(P)H-hydrate epimerase
MKVLTAAEMREVDRRTIEMGTPGIVLMENAAHRVVEFLAERFAPLGAQRIAVLCGKGNNGGDGMAVARQIFTRFRPQRFDVVLLAEPESLKGDAAANYKMLEVCGCPVLREIPSEAQMATLVVDALLGTGITGPATGSILDAIREINRGFPLAKVVAVDLPSGMPTDTGEPVGEWARADASVTFTAPKLAHVMPPNCDHVGELRVGQIGSPPRLYEQAQLSLVEPAMFRTLLAPRDPGGHKGTYGHVLVVAGSRGKTGAARMSGLAALRAGAGLVTVASRAQNLPLAPELMSGSLEESGLAALAEGKTVIAMGPGLGRDSKTESLVAEAVKNFRGPVVLDADALEDREYGGTGPRILTPHPGEMGRLTGKTTADIQKDRIGAARAYATARGCTLVLKGQRSLLAFSDGRVWINPTGTPAMGTGGSGDVLTGLIAGFLSQFPKQPNEALAAAVYLHGLAGELGARKLGEKSLIATDILRYLPGAIEEATEACAGLPDAL